MMRVRIDDDLVSWMRTRALSAGITGIRGTVTSQVNAAVRNHIEYCERDARYHTRQHARVLKRALDKAGT